MVNTKWNSQPRVKGGFTKKEPLSRMIVVVIVNCE